MTCRVTRVSVAVTETCADGMTAPDESLTVPLSVAPATCPRACAAKNVITAEISTTDTQALALPEDVRIGGLLPRIRYVFRSTRLAVVKSRKACAAIQPDGGDVKNNCGFE